MGFYFISFISFLDGILFIFLVRMVLFLGNVCFSKKKKVMNDKGLGVFGRIV